MTMFARFQAAEDLENRRHSHRRLLKLQVAGVIADGPGIDVFIQDLSLSGLLIETCANLPVGTQIEVDLPEAGHTIAQVVWSTCHYFGCQFNSPIPAAAVSAALLKNPVAPPRSMSVADSTGVALPVAEKSDLLSLSTRMRIIIALAIAVWAAIFLAIALN